MLAVEDGVEGKRQELSNLERIVIMTSEILRRNRSSSIRRTVDCVPQGRRTQATHVRMPEVGNAGEALARGQGFALPRITQRGCTLTRNCRKLSAQSSQETQL